MTSAIFFGAGHSTPFILGGPWHAGDEITLSMLLRNEGDSIGSAHLEIEIVEWFKRVQKFHLTLGKQAKLAIHFQ